MEQKMSLRQASESVKEVDLLDFFRYACRKFKIIAAASLTGFLLAAIYAMVIATPIYEATTQLYVVNSKESVVNLSDLQMGTYLTSDYRLVFQTWEVNQQVIENLGLPYTVNELRSMLEVTNPSNTRALFITVSSPDAAEAAMVANEFAEVASQYISDTMLTDKPTIFSTALEPLSPAKPRVLLCVLLGLLIGLLVSTWGLFIAYTRDDKINTGDDILKYTGTHPLAIIPVAEKAYERRNRGR